MSSADTDTPTDETSAPDGTEEAAEPTETDAEREALLERITGLLGDAIVESHIDPGHDLVIRVATESWKQVHKTLRDDAGFRFFEFLSAIDWMPSPFGKSEDASVDLGQAVTLLEDPGPTVSGVAGGETRFQVFSRLRDIGPVDRSITIKTDLPDAADGTMGSVETIIAVFPGADWHERETHEMFGVGFTGHPHLEKLYLPTGFEGHPLRKDFPLLARHVKPWPGIVDVEPMPDEGDDDEEGDDS